MGEPSSLVPLRPGHPAQATLDVKDHPRPDQVTHGLVQAGYAAKYDEHSDQDDAHKLAARNCEGLKHSQRGI